jgi:hypothetical protein
MLSVPGLLTGFVFSRIKNNVAAHKKGADAPPRAICRRGMHDQTIESRLSRKLHAERLIRRLLDNSSSLRPAITNLEPSSFHPATVMKTMRFHGH